MDGIRADLKKRPVDGFDGHESEVEIMQLLEKHGVKHGAWSMEHGEETRERGSEGAREREVSVTVWGTGKPLREFMYSGDMADATVYIMEKVSFKDLRGEGNEVRNTHINIGTGEEITIKDLASLLKETTGFRGRLEFDSSKPDGTSKKFLDSSKLHGLGFRHSTSLKEGAMRMYEWYLASLKA
jgi:GDP-L-fucose synthase